MTGDYSDSDPELDSDLEALVNRPRVSRAVAVAAPVVAPSRAPVAAPVAPYSDSDSELDSDLEALVNRPRIPRAVAVGAPVVAPSRAPVAAPVAPYSDSDSELDSDLEALVNRPRAPRVVVVAPSSASVAAPVAPDSDVELDSDLEALVNRPGRRRFDAARAVAAPVVAPISAPGAAAVPPLTSASVAAAVAPLASAPVVTATVFTVAPTAPTVLERLGVTNVDDLTQDLIEKGNPQLRRFQMDLLVLTSLPETSINWRPSWFPQGPSKMWHCYNPPDVVTVSLPYASNGSPNNFAYFTRRMRQKDDPPSLYIKTWDAWNQYCAVTGVPKDFLNKDMIKLMRLGLLRAFDGSLVAPPSLPRYPEPWNTDLDHWVLDPSLYHTFPPPFRNVHTDKVVVMRSNGALEIQPRQEQPTLSQWQHKTGNVQFEDNPQYEAGSKVSFKKLEPGMRWSYLPWTGEQDGSCQIPAPILGVDQLKPPHSMLAPPDTAFGATPSRRHHPGFFG